MSLPLEVRYLGEVAYPDALELQRRVAAERIDGTLDHDVLLLLEHPAVITLGRLADQTNLRGARAGAEVRGVEVFEIERGGDVTFHGPGQLVGYPIFDLTQHRPDLHWYLRQLEATLIEAIRLFGIKGERREGYTGVWVEDRKLASIGIHVKQWVTWHGFALNVNTDLSSFDLIIPCGIPGVIMTSIKNEAGAGSDTTELWSRTISETIRAFETVFAMTATVDAAIAGD